MSAILTHEITLSITRAGKSYDVIIECRGEWTDENLPATRLDPAEFVNYAIYDMHFLEAKGLIDDVVAENSADSVEWLTEFPHEDYETLGVPVEVKLGPGAPSYLEIIYERKTPLEAFKLSSRNHFLFSIEDYCIGIINEEEGA